MDTTFSSVEKILIVGPAWVGDMVMAHGLFRLLKQLMPNAKLSVIAPASTYPLLRHMQEVDTGYLLPIGHGPLALSARFQFGKKLREAQYTRAIVLPNSWKSALIPWAARVPVRTGFLGEQRYGLLNDIRRLEPQILPRMLDQFLALGLPKATNLSPELKRIQPVLQTSMEDYQPVLAHLKVSVDLERPRLILCPGAEFGPAKRWPTRHFGRLAKMMHAQGVQILILGSQKEQPLAQEIQTAAGNVCLDLTGKTNLSQAIGVMSLASWVVTNDSGLMHIAAALKRPTVAIYGSSSPYFTPPLHQEVEILSLNLQCSPCFARECPLKGEQHLRCLNALSPERVLSALENLVPTEQQVCATSSSID